MLTGYIGRPAALAKPAPPWLAPAMPAPPQIVAGLSDLASSYPAVICDVWGVVHNGRRAFAPACDALERCREAGGRVVLLSNSPRPRGAFIRQLRQLGVPDGAGDAVVTSGDATRRLLAERAPGPALAVGPPRDAPIYEGLDLAFAERAEDAAFISCTGLYDDEHEGPEDYRALFAPAVARGLELICANPDRVVQRGEEMVPCAGALADLYEAMGGKVLMAGKPYAPLYDLARRELAAALGREPRTPELLAIGDGLPTDVAGANAQGIDCLFVLGGIHAAELGGALTPQRAQRLLAEANAHARYAMADLVW
jgi:HAD superfamily hydrolase (TIGR01459 family)